MSARIHKYSGPPGVWYALHLRWAFFVFKLCGGTLWVDRAGYVKSPDGVT